MATILLTGANGKVSSAAIAALQGSGHKLVALVRDESKGAELAKKGVELRVGDLDKLRTVENLFGGVDVAFVLTAPGPNAPIQSSNALWAARQGGVKHVLRMSAVGAAHTAPTINSRLHALSDSELIASGIAYTIVKPHFFTQNLLGVAQTVKEQGMIFFGLGEAKLPMVDLRDIADSVAAILTNPAPHAGKTYTLTGPAAVSMHQVASAVGEAIGKPVKYQPVPVPAVVDMITKLGVDDYQQTAMRDYLTAYSGGWEDTVTTAVNDLTGHAPRGIQEFARDYAAAFRS